MEKIYEVKGAVNEGFVGQISYSVCLDREYSHLDICFSFDKDKQRYDISEINDEIREKFRKACEGKYDIAGVSDEELTETIKGNCKTEIHLSAHMNNEFIGCIHKQLSERHMIFSPDETSEGCLPQKRLSGVLKVTLLVFNVIKDDTNYTLSIMGE